MEANRPEQYAWWAEHRHHVVVGKKMDYEDIHSDLAMILEKGETYKWACRQMGVPARETTDD